MALLLSSQEPRSLSHLPAIVRVKNLQSIIEGPQDAWGRINRPQPLSLTASVGFSEAFGASSAGDALNSDTVHYGLLAKALGATLHRLAGKQTSMALRNFADALWKDLTGFDTRGGLSGSVRGEPFLDPKLVSGVEIVARLPKASLVGGGASLTTRAWFEKGEMVSRSVALQIHDLRVPTLIGVNANERLAKQVVVANIEVENLDDAVDKYCGIEEVVVSELTESSFETLEALGMCLVQKITKHLKDSHEPVEGGWQINITLEKPIAIVLADASCVELRVKTTDVTLQE